ncbi:TIGR03915 family putative DNA repair protein [Natranaerobius thermophilus]|uniref:DUF4130 domain-containing protein n=1 Tax=Natranaerobius thermophilus (strain ATCC BAA-1301 / DSM 18059 / JW/NM-WN-LF) TaxID=457570 RepID=B2A8E5_NATTJ|nr:TIGR03915 family putative DNA repair protein [Natranaerobius thermophilus]ACB84509.1 conserved hypothetical protein [Natranaerobius thermophilus JW/NM-WN-LF]
MHSVTYYIYDGTYEGLLTSLYYVFKSSENTPKIVPSGTNLSQELFAEYKNVTTHQQLAKTMTEKINSKISKRALSKIYYAFLSEIEGIETSIYHYLKLGFQKGNQVDEMLSEHSVHTVNQLSQKVSRERHRMLGFLRFKKLQSGVYYAPMEPDHNILTLIAPHFKKRLADQSWIIHDKRRDKCALYNGKSLIYTTDNLPANKLLEHKEEEQFQNMWKQYFRHVSIPERQNLKLQQQFLPKKYWKYLTEKNQ